MDSSIYITQGTEVIENSKLPADPPLLFSKGLRGQGQIIGIADTGIDHDGCFFHDVAVPLPLCKTVAGTGRRRAILCHAIQEVKSKTAIKSWERQ